MENVVTRCHHVLRLAQYMDSRLARVDFHWKHTDGTVSTSVARGLPSFALPLYRFLVVEWQNRMVIIGLRQILGRPMLQFCPEAFSMR